MRVRPFAFLRIGDRWINMSMVTDIEDHGETLVVFLASDMARLAGDAPVDVARRFTVSESKDVDKLRTWLRLNDED